jgi:hypothetical protein
MRAIDCPRGHHLEATEDEEMFGKAREHIAADAYDVAGVAG